MGVLRFYIHRAPGRRVEGKVDVSLGILGLSVQSVPQQGGCGSGRVQFGRCQCFLSSGALVGQQNLECGQDALGFQRVVQ